MNLYCKIVICQKENYDKLYVDEYRNRLNLGATKVEINSNLYDFQRISEEESLFETLISNSNIEYRYTDYYNNDSSASISISFCLLYTSDAADE